MTEDSNVGHTMFRLKILKGTPWSPEDRDDRSPVESLIRHYRASESTTRRALALGAIAALEDPEPQMRACALMFFASLGDADDGGALCRMLEHRLDLYDETPDPYIHGSDLRGSLVRALAGRFSASDHTALALLRTEVMRPGRGNIPIAGLVRRDTRWVLGHVAEIVSRSPGALDPILWHFKSDQASLLAVVRAVRSALPSDKLREILKQGIPNADLRERAMALVEG